MLVVTGGAGFIGSALIWQLNELGIEDIIVVDHLGTGPKWKNLAKRHFSQIIHKDDFLGWLKSNKDKIDGIFHMGACSSTTEEDADYLVRNNLQYSIDLFNYCTTEKIPFIYASSAATYGSREQDFFDDDAYTARSLRPINKYGFSKHVFDCWVLKQEKTPPFWAGLKFFNVYGPNEYHKGGQASVVFHAFPQIRDEGQLRLFKSHKEGYADGEQQRDFVYVKDVVKVIWHLFEKKKTSGIYNLGTGQARSFLDLGKATFTAMGKPVKIEWIKMPETLRGQYQYFTKAELKKLREQGGYNAPFFSLEEGVADYVNNYLQKEDPFF